MTLTDLLLITFLILVYVLQSLSIKCFSGRYPGKSGTSSDVFTVVSGITVAVVTLAVIGFRFAASPLTVVLGLANSVTLVIYNASMIRASVNGPFSVTMVFSISGGIVIPTISAAVLPLFIKQMGAPVLPSAIKLVSVALVLVSVYLVSRKAGETYVNKKLYFLYALGVGITNGVYGALLDAQQKLTGVAEKEEMAIISYLVAALLSAVLLLIREKRDFLPAFRQTKGSLLFLLLGSAMITLAINILGILLGLVNVTVLYTMNNAGVFILSVLFSWAFFKEKLTRLNVIGIVLVCIGLVGVAF